MMYDSKGNEDIHAIKGFNGATHTAIGRRLMLPSWLESKRAELEETLPSVEVRILEGNNNEAYIQ
ncbi:hypothetical protein KDN24_18055 [Bacillus sp. Bva_UNVM-123]|uniref:hypothetical protein n=1 Tax=Bacillus sp. Bva_UNVM-123 TaxID=2829798 RepID=UPI00391FC41D